MTVTASAIIALSIFAVGFILIATEKIHRVAVVLGCASLMVLLGFVPGTTMFYSEHSGIDWNVIFLLLGMMIIVGIIKQTGVFEALGIWAAQKSRGRPYRLMVLLMAITAIASPFLDNVTMIMLIAPVTLSVCRRLQIPAAPYLIAEVLASNIGGAATIVGDPPNIIIASQAGLTYNDFIIHMTPITIILFGMFVVLARFMFRKSFVYNPDKVDEIAHLNAKEYIKDRKLLVRTMVVLAIITVGFTLHATFHFEPSVIALLGAGLMVMVSGVEPFDYLSEIETPTLVFFMGLFVMVGGLIETGVIEQIGLWAIDVIGGDFFLAASSLLLGSAVLGAFFDNIPYAATMAPIVSDIVATAPDPQTGQSLWWAFALGADLGGNGTAVAASANVVMLGIAARHGQPISFWQFTKYGIVTTVFTTLIALGYVWLRYFAFG